MNDGAKFNRKVQAFTAAFPRSQEFALGAASLSVKRAVEGLAPKRLSGVGRKGARIGVKYRVSPAHGKYGAVSFVNAYGPFHLIERPTKPHTIKPKRGVGMKFPDGNVRRGRVRHPGTAGKYPWKRGVALAEPQVKAIYRRAFNTQMRSFFGF